MGATPGTDVRVAVGMGVDSLTEALRSSARRGEDPHSGCRLIGVDRVVQDQQ